MPKPNSGTAISTMYGGPARYAWGLIAFSHGHRVFTFCEWRPGRLGIFPTLMLSLQCFKHVEIYFPDVVGSLTFCNSQQLRIDHAGRL
jgi:hypothetical protein